MTENFGEYVESALKLSCDKKVENATLQQLYNACGKALNALCREKPKRTKDGKRACYFSAEFLIGRLIYSNMYNLGVLKEAEGFLKLHSRSLGEFESIEDAALGNGGLGRLAACFLDSAASTGIPLDGYGIRYRYGLFKQEFEAGAQKELADNWLKDTDPFGVRRDDEAVSVDFSDMSVTAVPYDYYVIGKDTDTVNRLRLYQSESKKPFNLAEFSADSVSQAYSSAVSADAISAVLYPDDSDDEGKMLRIRQQYFFCSAALQNIINELDKKYCDTEKLYEYIVIQLNDTHPTVAIPELIRLLMLKSMSFEKAFEISQKVFAYTNHTVMSEALEKWDAKLYCKLLPKVYAIIELIDKRLVDELVSREIPKEKIKHMRIIDGGILHMARLAVYSSFSVNGVARIHTQILKNDVLSNWYSIYPQRFSNKTNGITQRRWLALANPELSDYLCELIGKNIIDEPQYLSELKSYADDLSVLERLNTIKRNNKLLLAQHIKEYEGVEVNPESIFTVQVKRIHEYKRQLMNALSIADIYLMLKSGAITDLPPITVIIGGKAAAGYKTAKGIIRYINALAELINSDTEVNQTLKVVFVHNYNVSYAEKIIPSADISEQISLAGTEASGTGNMKLMLNGAVTLGTFDGANIEIVGESGLENNYIFGLTESQVREKEETYDSKSVYSSDSRIKRAVDTLIDGTVSDYGTGEFRDIYNSLLKNDEWHKADRYFVLEDLLPYTKARLDAARDYTDRISFAKKSLMNIAGAGVFSSDRTIAEYAKQIWFTENS